MSEYLIRDSTLAGICDAVRVRNDWDDPVAVTDLKNGIGWLRPVNLLDGGSLTDMSKFTIPQGAWFTFEQVTDLTVVNTVWPRALKWTCTQQVPEGTYLRILQSISTAPTSMLVTNWTMYVQMYNPAATALNVRWYRQYDPNASQTSGTYSVAAGGTGISTASSAWTKGVASIIRPVIRIDVGGPIEVGQEFYLLGIGAIGTDSRYVSDVGQVCTLLGLTEETVQAQAAPAGKTPAEGSGSQGGAAPAWGPDPQAAAKTRFDPPPAEEEEEPQ